MYIDKIYTKLYSDRNWKGLSILLDEIKTFTRADYQGLNTESAKFLQGQRDELARKIRAARNEGRSDEVNKWSQSTLPQLKGDARDYAEQYHNYLTIQPTYDQYKDKSDSVSKSQYYVNDTEALSKAVQENKDKLLGSGKIGRLDSQSIPIKAIDGKYWNNLDNGRYMISGQAQNSQLPTKVGNGTYYADWNTLDQRLQENNQLQNANPIKRFFKGTQYRYTY